MRRSSCQFLAVAAVVALVLDAGCLEREPVGEVGEPNLATVQMLVFTPRCATSDCHGGATPKKELNLEPGNSVDSLVGVLAQQAPLYLVFPGDSESSYLIDKLRGTMDEVGGSGESMPLDDTPLSDAEIALVADWIDSLVVDLPPPVVTSVTPAAASIGSAVLIGGETFGPEQGDSVVTFGGVEATVSAWSATVIEATVPDSLSPGSAPVVVTVGDKASDPFPFDVLSEAVPSVIEVVPDTSAVGGTVEVRGSNFGDSQVDSTVLLGAVAADTFASWSDTSIEVVVPAGAASSDVTVTVDGVSSNSVSIWLVEPTLSSIQETVLTRLCADSCHNETSDDPDPAIVCPPEATTGSLDLRAGLSYAGMVGVDSCMLPGTARVTPSNRSTSFLYLKIASGSPPIGSRMPLSEAALRPEVVEAIGAWIDSGAANN